MDCHGGRNRNAVGDPPAFAGNRKPACPGRARMKPPTFGYLRAATLAEALHALKSEGAKVIAGGQSLMPMLNFRLLRPSLLVDINRLGELDTLEETAGGGLRIGALTRHRTLEFSPLVRARFPILAAAAAEIGHLAIRNRGTIGGSLSHADPAAELLLMSVLLDARLTVQSHGGTRTVRAADHIAGALSTTLKPAEIVTAVALPPLAPGTGWGFGEVARRSGDFALAAVAVLIRRAGDSVGEARIAVSGGMDGPVRIRAAEDALHGSRCDARALAAAARAVRAGIEANSDLHASPALRHHLLDALLGRACTQAWDRAATA